MILKALKSGINRDVGENIWDRLYSIHQRHKARGDKVCKAGLGVNSIRRHSSRFQCLTGMLSPLQELILPAWCQIVLSLRLQRIFVIYFLSLIRWR